MSYPKTFCTRPFNELHIEEDGRITPCCVIESNQQFFGNNIAEYLRSDKLKRLKRALASGEKPPECSSCWKAEKFKQYSHRTVDTNNSLDKIVRIHIRYNDFCNFKCRICSPTFSSAWAKENKIHKEEQTYSPMTNVVGSGQLIEGFEESLLEAKANKDIELEIPPEKAYGERKSEDVETYGMEKMMRFVRDPESLAIGSSVEITWAAIGV